MTGSRMTPEETHADPATALLLNPWVPTPPTLPAPQAQAFERKDTDARTEGGSTPTNQARPESHLREVRPSARPGARSSRPVEPGRNRRLVQSFCPVPTVPSGQDQGGSPNTQVGAGGFCVALPVRSGGRLAAFRKENSSRSSAMNRIAAEEALMRPVSFAGVEGDECSSSGHDRHQSDEEWSVAATPHVRDNANEQQHVGTDADRRVVDEPFLRHRSEWYRVRTAILR